MTRGVFVVTTSIGTSLLNFRVIMNHQGPDPIRGLLYSFGGVILLSSNFITAKYALNGFNPETFSVVWTSAAAIFSFAIALAGKSSRTQIVPRQNMKAMIALGAITGIGMVLTWNGLARLDPVFSSFLWRFFPIMAILAGVIFLKEKLSKYEIIAMLVMLAGSIWSVKGRWDMVGPGVILTMLAGFAAAAQLLIVKSLTNFVHVNVMVAYRVGIGAGITAAWALANRSLNFNVELSYWYITLLGAFLGPCASFLLTFRAYRYWNLSQSSIVLTVQPLLVLPLASFFLGTFPTEKELTGGLVILLGAFWLALVQIRK